MKLYTITRHSKLLPVGYRRRSTYHKPYWVFYHFGNEFHKDIKIIETDLISEKVVKMSYSEFLEKYHFFITPKEIKNKFGFEVSAEALKKMYIQEALAPSIRDEVANFLNIKK